MLGTLGASDVEAAQIASANNATCSFRLLGEIVPGDLARLKASGIRSQDSICLEGPGGSFEEGLNIAEFIIDHNIHTIIESYSNCLSACAIVFAAGSDWEDGVVLPNRKMHYSATLGFHAPFVTLPGSQYSAEQAEKLFSAGLRAVARMMTLGDQGDGTGVIPNRVILELLKRGPGELYMVDTPLKADELGIDLLGVPKARWSKRKACNACLIKNQGRAVNDACDAMNDAPITLRRTGDVSLIFDGFGGEGAYQCIVKLRGDGVGRVEADIVPLATEDEFPLRDYEFLSLTDQDALDPWIPFSDLNGGN